MGSETRGTHTESPPQRSPRTSPRWEGPAAALGGLLWFLYYAVDVWAGLQTGQVASSDLNATPLSWLGFSSFGGGLLFLDFALVGLPLRLQGRARWPARGALVLAALALTASTLYSLLLSGLTGSVRLVQEFGAIGVLSSCVSATFLGIAMGREATLPRPASTLLRSFGGLMVALLILSNFHGPFPAYAMDGLPFGIAGLVWIFLGSVLWRTPPVFRAPAAAD
ncbi:hypothetical protein [Vitiosangium sp. GDMCC 1.1324]|uniref:hypothetical protein n=1 Tax=Vitiosangium sp. (strain GDMCC 1.1324) TaxID=2138576 RepID=UPI000D3B5170|nr:hypothetical protein [Vitiosangium sp. GDMCC 1.1324]PTL79251.1 hypothetical protein DAT35_34150 [Vitiosangium sp. GDMCC 1.1324]